MRELAACLAILVLLGPVFASNSESDSNSEPELETHTSSVSLGVWPVEESILARALAFEPVQSQEDDFGRFLLRLIPMIELCEDSFAIQQVQELWNKSSDHALFAALTSCHWFYSASSAAIAQSAIEDGKVWTVFNTTRTTAQGTMGMALESVVAMEPKTVLGHELRIHLGRQLGYLHSSNGLANESMAVYARTGAPHMVVQAFDNLLHGIHRSQIIQEVAKYQDAGPACQLNLSISQAANLHQGAIARLIALNERSELDEDTRTHINSLIKADRQPQFWLEHDLVEPLVWEAATLHWKAYAWETEVGSVSAEQARSALNSLRAENLDWYESAKLALFDNFDSGFAKWEKNPDWAVLAVNLDQLVNPIAGFCEPVTNGTLAIDGA